VRAVFAIIAGCIVVIILAFAFVPRPTDGALATDAANAGDSQRVAALLAHFPSPDTGYALVVWTRHDGGALTSEDRRSVDARVTALASLWPQSTTLRPQLAPDRTAMLAQVDVAADAAKTNPAGAVRRLRSAAASELSNGLEARLTGPVVSAADNEDTGWAVTSLILLLALIVLVGLGVALVIRASRRFVADTEPNSRRVFHPVATAIIVAVVLGLLATGAVGVRLAVTASGVPHASAESVEARRIIDRAFGVGTGNEEFILVPKSLSGATSVVAPTTLAMALPAVHSVTRNGSHDGQSELVVAVNADPGSAAALRTTENLRAAVARAGGSTARTLVGGPDAELLDARNAAQTDLATVIPGAVALLAIIAVVTFVLERRRRRVTTPQR